MIRSFLAFIFLLVLLACGVAALTTNWAFERIWLPRMAKSLALDVKASRISWIPRSGVVIDGLDFRSADPQEGWEQVQGRIEKVEIGYDLTKLANGVFYITLLEVRDADITWTAPDKEKNKERQLSKAKLHRSEIFGIPLETGPVTFRNFKWKVRYLEKNGRPLEFCHHLATLKMDGYEPKKASRITFSSSFNGNITPALKLDKVLMTGIYNLVLDADFHFRQGTGELTAVKIEGQNGEMPIRGYEATHTFELEPYRLKQASLMLKKDGVECLSLRASGPVDFNLKTADILITLNGMTPDSVNLLTAPYGAMMQSGEISVSGQFRLSQESLRVQSEALLSHGKFRRVSNTEAIPELDGKLVFAAEQFLKRHEVQVDRAEMKLFQNKQPFIEMSLNKAVHLAWGSMNPSDAREAEMNAIIHPTDITLFKEAWMGLDGVRCEAGLLSGAGKLTVAEAGQELSWNGQGQIESLTGQFKGLELRHGTIEFITQGTLTDFSRLNLAQIKLAARDQSISRANIQITGKKDATSGQFHANIDGHLNWLATVLPGMPDCEFEQGDFIGSVNVNWLDPKARQISFSFGADNLRGSFSVFTLEQASAKLVGEIQTADNEARLRAAKLSFKPAPNLPTGEISAGGAWNHATQDYMLQAFLTGWNEGNLTPLFNSYAKDRVVKIGGAEGTVTVKQVGGVRSLEGQVELKQALLADKILVDMRQLKPSDVVFAVKASGPKTRMEIINGSLDLTPVDGFENKISFSGWYKTAREFDLKASGTSVDFSPVSGLFKKSPVEMPTPKQIAAQESAKQKKLAPPQKTPPAKTASRAKMAITRPDVAVAPQKDGGLDVELIKKHHRKLQVQIDRLLAPPYPMMKLQVQGSHADRKLVLKPFSITLSDGASGSASFTWDFQSAPPPFSASVHTVRFPVSLARIFLPLEYSVLDQGLLTMDANVQGEGANWEALKPNLKGDAQVELQQASLENMPAVASFLKAAAKHFPSEVGQARAHSLSGRFTIGEGRITTEDTLLSSDSLKLLLRGDFSWDQRLSAQVQFTGKTEMIEKTQFKIGSVQVGGANLIAIGKTESGWTTLPGFLPIKGTINEAEPDWQSWLIGSGLGAGKQAIQGMIENLIKVKEKKARE